MNQPRRPRVSRPHLEQLEVRDVPSGIIAAQAAAHGTILSRRTNDNGVMALVQTAATEPESNQFLDPTGQPTAHERVRQHFWAGFSGKFLQGPGRYNDEASTIYIKGVGSSEFYLHGDIQIGLVVPTDPARPVSGVAVSFDRNTSSNSSLGIDLTGSQADLDRFGRPTHLTFTIDDTLSSGVFGESDGTGTVDIRYLPTAASRRGLSQGRALVVIKGEIHTLGVNNVFGVLGSVNTLNPAKIKF